VDDRLTSLLRDLQAIADRQDRAKALSGVLGGIPDLQATLREVRQDLLTELHNEDGLSYGQIAAITGVSRGRVKQIIDGQTISGRLLKKSDPDNGAPPADS
jgi:hypothetical protein